METFELTCQTGSINPRPTTIFCAKAECGGTWYVAEGGELVNLTYDEITEGCSIEELHDADCFSWDLPIVSLDELEETINV